MGELEGSRAEALRANPSSAGRELGRGGSAAGLDGGFGTLGVSSEDPTSFFGVNEGAHIDADGFLHGLPPFDALEGGLMVFVSLALEECIQLHLAQCWPAFAAALEMDLEAAAGDSDDCAERGLRDKAQSLRAQPPSRVPFENGVVAIPRAVMEAAGFDGGKGASGEEVIVTGNEGYFEVFSKAGHEKMVQGLDLFDVLFGE